MTYILKAVFREGAFHLVDEAPAWLEEGQIATTIYEVEEAADEPGGDSE